MTGTGKPDAIYEEVSLRNFRRADMASPTLSAVLAFMHKYGTPISVDYDADRELLILWKDNRSEHVTANTCANCARTCTACDRCGKELHGTFVCLRERGHFCSKICAMRDLLASVGYVETASE